MKYCFMSIMSEYLYYTYTFTYFSLLITSIKHIGITIMIYLKESSLEKVLKQDVGWSCAKCGTCQKAKQKLTAY